MRAGVQVATTCDDTPPTSSGQGCGRLVGGRPRRRAQGDQVRAGCEYARATRRRAPGAVQEPNTRASSRGPAPWAPTPGASSGPFTADRSTPVRSAASPTVAPTTSPMEPSGFASAFSAAARAAMSAATLTPSEVRACWTSCPSLLEVRHRTNRPRPGGERQVDRRVERTEAQVGRDGECVAGQRGAVAQERVRVRRHGRADVAALGVDDRRACRSPARRRSPPRAPRPRASRAARRTPPVA